MMLPATDGARDPAGDGGATDETADMLDIALSARAPPPPAVAAGGPPAAPRPVWMTAAGASAAGWPRPLPRPATAIDGGRDGGAAGGAAWASPMLPRRPPSIAHNRPEPVRTRLFARPVKPRARNGGSIFGRAAHARAAAKRRGGAAECARGGVGRWTCTHAGVQTCTRTRHFLLACMQAGAPGVRLRARALHARGADAHGAPAGRALAGAAAVLGGHRQRCRRRRRCGETGSPAKAEAAGPRRRPHAVEWQAAGCASGARPQRTRLSC